MRALEEKAVAKAALIKNTSSMLVQESKRMQDLQALYQAQGKSSEGIFSGIQITTNAFR